jgi:hypothetical protein
MCSKRIKLKELRERVDDWRVAGEDAQAVGFLNEAMELLEEIVE